MKYLFIAVSSFLAIAAQTIAGSNFFLFNFLDLSLLLIAYWATYRSRTQALFTGALTGLLLDAMLGWPLGYNGFGKTLAAFAIGQMVKRVNIDEIWIRYTIIASASCLNSLSIFILFWLMQRPTNSIYLGSSLIQALITAGVGILVFAVVDSYRQAQTRKVG
jgi:rod shape-determining protein MreD